MASIDQFKQACLAKNINLQQSLTCWGSPAVGFLAQKTTQCQERFESPCQRSGRAPSAAFQDKKLQKEMEKLNRKPVEALENQIAVVEKKIRVLIKEDDSLKHLFDLVTSVDGVGEAAAAAVVFCEMVIATNERPTPGLNCLAVPESLPLGGPIATLG